VVASRFIHSFNHSFIHSASSSSIVTPLRTMPKQLILRTIDGATAIVPMDDASYAAALASRDVERALVTFVRARDASAAPPGTRFASRVATECASVDVYCALTSSLRGGKGGFGTQLRTSARRRGATTNFDACRDASGRRLRNANGERKIAEWERNENERAMEREGERYAEELARHGDGKKLREVEEREREAYAKESERAKASVNEAVTSGLKEARAVEVEKRLAEKAVKARHGKMVVSDSDSGSDDDALLYPAKKAKTAAGEARENAASTSKSAEARAPTVVAKTMERAPSRASTVPTPISSIVAPAPVPSVVAPAPAPVPSPPATARDEAPEDAVPLDLQSFPNPAALEAVGLDKLKRELVLRKLKCGGTLTERAARLFLARDNARDDIDKKHWAK